MKTSIAAAFALAATLGVAGAANAATVYATEIYTSTGSYADSQVMTMTRSDAGNALGAADGSATTGGFYSLGIGGFAIFGFGTSFGTEATVFEITGGYNCNGVLCSGYPESVEVFTTNLAIDLASLTSPISLATLGFTSAGTLGNGTAQGGGSIALGVGPFTYLALVDTSPGGSGRDGFDVDAVSVSAVEAVSVSAVPLPASALFLLAGLGGLGFLRSRRKAA